MLPLNSTFRKCNPPISLKIVADKWIEGEPFYKLFQCLTDNNAKIGFGDRPRIPKIDQIVDICENALSFDGSLVLGAIIEMLRYHQKDDEIIENLEELQKRLKYGLPSLSAIAFYEAGFSDRVIAMHLCELIETDSSLSRMQIKRIIRKNEKEAREIIRNYPSYYSERFNGILG